MPRKKPVQRRAKLMVETILDAAARILERQGSAALTTNRIAEVAGVSVGTLYQYFPNKAAIVTALTDRHMEEVHRTVDEVWGTLAGQSLEAKLRILISRAVALHLARPALHRELDIFDSARHFDGDRSRKGIQRLQAVVMLEEHRGELIVDDIVLALMVLRAAVRGSIQEALTLRLDITAERLTDELTGLCLRYLTGRDGAKPARRRKTRQLIQV